MSKKPMKIVHIHHGKENYKTVMTAGNHESIADEPVNLGGQATGPDPYDYLLMSLGSCTVITIKMYADRKKWPVEDVFVELRHFKSHAQDCNNCEKSDTKIDYIEKDIIVKGDISDDQLDKLLEISDKCPVHRTLLGQMNIASAIER